MGDVIVAAEGKTITNMDDFVRVLQTLEIGEVINLKVRREDKVREVAVTIMDIS